MLAIILPILIFWVLYHDALNGWWKWDDFCNLEYEHRNALGEPILEKQTPIVYGPIHFVFRQIDILLFGLNPTWFYWHHLLFLTVVIILLGRIFLFFYSPILTGIVVSLIVVSSPMTDITYFLMLRTYVEPLIFALLSTECYLMAVKQRRMIWAMVGSLFYLLAVSNIVFAPLLAIFMVLPMGKIKDRIYMLLPFIFISIFYVGWRTYLLGVDNFIAPPNYYLHIPTLLDILKFPYNRFFLGIMGWRTCWQWMPFLVVVFGFTIALYKNLTYLGLQSLIWISAISAPLIPVLYRLDGFNHVYFTFVLLLYIGYAVALQQLIVLKKTYIVMLVVIFSLLANLPAVQTRRAFAQRVDLETRRAGEFFLDSAFPSNATLIHGHHCGIGLTYMRRKVLRQPDANWCISNSCSCRAIYPNSIGYRYDGSRWMTEILSPCSSTKELSVSFKLMSPQMLTWKVGPYQTGTYSFHLSNLDMLDYDWGQASVWFWFLSPDTQQVAVPEPKKITLIRDWTNWDEIGWFSFSPLTSPVVSHGSYLFSNPIMEPVKITVRYRHPDGWEVFSPPLTLDPNVSNQQQVTWEQ